MANKDYNFQYTPLTGRLPGNSFVKQTEQAINELAGIVNEGAAQVEVITNLANQANDNSEVALEKANEALETSGRVYITLPNLDDADDYYDSQLYYFANSYSHNLPVADTGFLEVKTNDTKTACEQVFIADDTGLCYFRHGVITATEVGDETVYSVTWETWSSALASQDYVQQEVNNGVDTANSYTDNKVADYLPLSGGTLTGDVNGVTPSDSDDSTKLATTEFVDNVFLSKIISKLQEVSDLPAGTSFPSTTVLSKMIANMMSEDGVQYYFSPGSDSAFYVKLGAKYGGLIIQGGRKYVPTTTSWTTLVLPITFSVQTVACAAVIGSTNGIVNMYFNGLGSVAYKASNGSWTSEPMHYIAIGF